MNDTTPERDFNLNVYHSTLKIREDGGSYVKWLDVDSLCRSYLNLFGKDATLAEIFYFSAIPDYLAGKNPNKIKRHKKKYLSALESMGIKIELGRFKTKHIFCDKCQEHILKHEEKETDVAIGVKAFEIFHLNRCDIAVVVSGDTDLSPVARKCQELFPDKQFVFAFPYKRKHRELQNLAPGSFAINQKKYLQHQLSNPVILKNGHKIFKPQGW